MTTKPSPRTSELHRAAQSPRTAAAVTGRWTGPARLAAVLLAAAGLALAPTAAEAGHGHGSSSYGYGYGYGYGSHAGRISVDNDRGETVTVYVDGVFLGAVRPYAVQGFQVRPGSHLVEVRDERGRSLEREQVYVSARGTAYVEVERVLMGRLAVSNPLDRPVMLHLDGKHRMTLAPYQKTTLNLPEGTVRLEMLLGDGRVIATELERIDRDRPSSWAPRPAMLGALRLENPLPIAVTVSLGQGRDRVLQPRSSQLVDGLPEGHANLVVRRLDGGEVVGEVPICIEAFDTISAQVPAPRTGILVVDNDRRREVEVRIDGRAVGLARVGLPTRFELSPGFHRVELISTRSGRVIESRQVRIDRYDDVHLDVPGSHPEYEHGHDDHLSLSFDAGRGFQVTASVDLD